MREVGVRAKFQFAPYNQVFQQLLDPNSIVSRNRYGFNVVLLRLTDWVRREDGLTDALKREKIEHSVRELLDSFRAHAATVPTFLCICPPEKKYDVPEWWSFLARMEQEIAAALSATTSIHVITSSDIFGRYPVENYA